MKFFIKIILYTIVLSSFVTTYPVLAAEVFFSGDDQKFAQGQEVVVSLFLNAQNESVNAIEGNIIFPDNLLELKELQSGNSIINFWIKTPKLNQVNGVEFSGIIPGGYHNSKGFLFSLIFKSHALGSGVIEVNDIKVLKNDGSGTLLATTFSPFEFSVLDIPVADNNKVKEEDINSPEDFMPEISKNPDIFDGKWFLAFATQDKGVGIDHYEVREGFFDNFTVAQNPYLLQNQKLNQKIFVKAVDKNNNERIVIFYPENFLPWYKNWWIFGILIISILLVLAFIIRTIWQKFIKSY